MTKSARIMKLVYLLAEAYGQAVGEKKLRPGTKLLSEKDYLRFFDKLAKHLTELRVATMVSETAFASTQPDDAESAGSESAEEPEPVGGTTPAHVPCEPGTIWCVLPAPLTSQCMTAYDCEQIGGAQAKPPLDDD